MDDIFNVIPAAIVVGMSAVLMMVLYLVRRYSQPRLPRIGLTSGLHSSPGQSLLPQIERLNEEVQTYLVYLMTFPWLVYALHVSTSYFQRIPESWPRSIFSISLGVSVCGFFLYKLLGLIKQRRKVHLDYTGVQAVGQELTVLITEGFSVFHDFPADGFHIDHILVGPGGIVAVETLVRTRPETTGKKPPRVIYDGESLVFPHVEDHEAIVRARRQARWLNQWLEQAIGQALTVKPMIVLPGWDVKRIDAGGIAVLNPKQLLAIVRSGNGHPLSEELIQRIGAQLGHRYR